MQKIKTIKETSLKDLPVLLERIFGKEHINRFTTDILPTVLIVNRGIFSQDVKWLKQRGWVIAGVHPEYDKRTSTVYLQVGLREVFEHE